MGITLTERIETQINHAKNCMDVDGTNKGFIKGLEFVKNVLLPDSQNEKDQRIAELEKEKDEKEDKILDLKSYNSDLKETISKLSFSAVRCQAINDEVCQYILDNELLKKENAELKSRVEELECQYSYECGCNAELVTTQQENAELKKLIETCQDEYDLQQFLKEENGVLARKNAELEQENEELEQKLENAILPKFRVGQEVWYTGQSSRNREIITKEKIISVRYEYEKFEYEAEYGLVFMKEDYCFTTEQEAREKLEELNNGKT